ncbi:hypothetical protein SCLCIDRAFT_31875 [Scleroderma citrinum Foug A]|uniref:Uncharacterized protein n=1 Tax=Scleroderma citrinum Foug A TaxID=1036808 RepID=A0A0C2YUZ0_9AGAM|nr:hypothetical protein SCLCIDRAFT_31875 [Scleroderma citrinum Foug A]
MRGIDPPDTIKEAKSGIEIHPPSKHPSSPQGSHLSNSAAMRLAFLSLLIAPLVTIVAGAVISPEALAIIIIEQTKPMCSKDGLPCSTSKYCCNHNCSYGVCRAQEFSDALMEY